MSTQLQSKANVSKIRDPSEDDADSGIEDCDINTAILISGSDLQELYRKYGCVYVKEHALFRAYDDSVRKLTEKLGDIANEIGKINVDGNRQRAQGSGISVIGGIAAIAAPFTGGASMVIATIAAGCSVAGTMTSCTAENKMNDNINKKMEKSREEMAGYTGVLEAMHKIQTDFKDIVDDLQVLFSELQGSFSKLIRSIGEAKYKTDSSCEVECMLKIVGDFVGVACTSTQVIRHVEEFTKMSLKIQQLRVVVKASKEVALRSKKVVLRCVIGRSQRTVSSAHGAVSTVVKTSTKSMHIRSFARVADGTGDIVQTATKVSGLSTKVTKETTTVVKRISRVGIAVGLVFVAYDAYQTTSALYASKGKCQAEKNIRQCIEDMKESSLEILRQRSLYSEVVKIKAFFFHLLDVSGPLTFGGEFPKEKVQQSVDRIENLIKGMDNLAQKILNADK